MAQEDLRKKEKSLLSVREILELSKRLQEIINQNNPELIEVPGQGRAWAAEITLPDGETRELGWARIRDESGGLVWTKKGSRLGDGEYSVIYVDPYQPSVRAAEIKEGGKKVLGVDWDEITELLSLLPEEEN